MFPHVSLWAVQSKVAPGRVGWWAFAGDGPTDIVSAAGARNPRAALRVLADQWADLADHMLQGQPHPSLKIGKPEEWPDLGRLLESRARTLREWADDNELWGADGELI